MKILVTGAKGFIGKNLIAELKNRNYTNIMEFDVDSQKSLLNEYTKTCEFVFHLAGANRPEKQDDYMKVNCNFTLQLLESLEKNGNTSPVLISSSIQALLDNPYGKSKKASEDVMFSYSGKTGARVLVYRLPNVFGKWCRPNYNSAIATFCNNIAYDLPIQVKDPHVIMNLAYIDDVVEEFIGSISGKEHTTGVFCEIPVAYKVSLGEIVELLKSFRNSRKTLYVPNTLYEFEKKLYSTYLSYLPKDQFSYPLTMKEDQRGSFTEIIRTKERGQFSVNISKPGITKGNHWHQTKNEKFLVVSGKGIVQLRKIGTGEIIEYFVDGNKMEVVDIPIGYTHNIVNVGEIDLVTFMWSNEIFNSQRPDTFFEEV